MSDFVKIAIDAMGGDNSPKKIIDGLIHNHQKNIFIELIKVKLKILSTLNKSLLDF